MSLSKNYWDYIANELEKGYGERHKVGHPKTWEQSTILSFLSDLEAKVKETCQKDKKIARLFDIQLSENNSAIKNWSAIDASVFRKIFINKITKNPQSKTKNQFAIYLGFNSWEDLVNSMNIEGCSVRPNQKIEDVQISKLKENHILKEVEVIKVAKNKVQSRNKTKQLLYAGILSVLLIGVILGIHFMWDKINSPINISVDEIQNPLISFPFDCSKSTNLKEAEAMLYSIGVNKLTSIEKGNYCSGMLNKKIEVTIWLNDYGKTDHYGVRYGHPDKSYFGSNDTYFTVPKCL